MTKDEAKLIRGVGETLDFTCSGVDLLIKTMPSVVGGVLAQYVSAIRRQATLLVRMADTLGGEP